MSRDTQGHRRHRGGRGAGLRTRGASTSTDAPVDAMGAALQLARSLEESTGVRHYVRRTRQPDGNMGPWICERWEGTTR